MLTVRGKPPLEMPLPAITGLIAPVIASVHLRVQVGIFVLASLSLVLLLPDGDAIAQNLAQTQHSCHQTQSGARARRCPNQTAVCLLPHWCEQNQWLGQHSAARVQLGQSAAADCRPLCEPTMHRPGTRSYRLRTDRCARTGTGTQAPARWAATLRLVTRMLGLGHLCLYRRPNLVLTAYGAGLTPSPGSPRRPWPQPRLRLDVLG